MSKQAAIIRLTLIVRKLRTKPSSFDEIYDYLQEAGEIHSLNFDISKRTFQRDIDDIAIIFSIDIEFDHSRKQYYIFRGKSCE